jgi:hypothetical protein
MLFITNAFSLNMLYIENVTTVSFTRITKSEAREWCAREAHTGAIGHTDTAAIVESDLQVPNLGNRISVKLTANDQLLVAQYIGPRLPEGTKTLPEGSEIQYFTVRIAR